jgi:hypothetical protein
MEYSPVEGDASGTKIVKFFVYLNSARQTAADLDGFGPKFVPNLCLNCHGGNFTFPATPVDVNLNSSFRELDVSTYKFPALRTTPTMAEQAAFKQQNQFIQSTLAARQPILDLIVGWYAPGGMGAIQNNAYTPTNWGLPGSSQYGLYHDVVKVSCRTCHIAFDSNDDASGLDWNRYDQFKINRDSIASIAVGAHISGSGRSMPHALVTYRNFWLDQKPTHRPKKLWGYNDPPDWLPIGAPLP